MTAIDLPTTATTTHADRSPARGVEHLVLFRIELTRLLRSPRSLAFTLLMPIVFLVVFSITAAGSATFPNGNSAAFVGVGMVLYTGIMAAGSTGATLGVERNRGWTRQLRLTPLTTASFLTVKITTALVRSLVGGAIIVVVELLLGRAVMTPTAWVLTTLIAWLGSAAFTGLGILIGAAAKTGTIAGTILLLLIGAAILGGAILVQRRVVDTGWDPSPARAVVSTGAAVSGSPTASPRAASGPDVSSGYPKIAPPTGAPVPPPRRAHEPDSPS